MQCQQQSDLMAAAPHRQLQNGSAARLLLSTHHADTTAGCDGPVSGGMDALGFTSFDICTSFCAMTS